MADQTDQNKPEKTSHALREEKVLAFWKERGIFEKSLNKWPAGKAPKGEFVFYEGPPTANGHPGIHHLEARAFKDAIPRYKTMQGFHVRRKGGWDTHGLPVEIQVEKELGFQSKKDIDNYGIGEFNEKCKESVWRYVHEWEDFTNRMGYWVDLKNPYITYKSKYIESVWNVIKEADKKDLLYKDYKVVPWCPRCGTALSSHELAQGYETVKDLAVTVEFRLKDKPGTSLLAWTTTPWTLPGNVGLAVNPKIDYVEIEKKDDGSGAIKHFILAKALLEKIFASVQFTVVKEMKGSDLVGLSYEPLYPFLKDNIKGAEKEKLVNAYKVYPADFVTTTDGTGIVHTAVMYGQDDFELGTKVGLPRYHLVNEDGTFKKEAGFLAGAFVKDPNTDVAIIKDLAGRGLLFAKEKYEHTYPFCWRCHTPLIYFARDSWYIRMSELRKKLVKENEDIHWEPEHIKEGRFGEWLREVKDWAISRERYWGTPLPVWVCEKCHSKKVVSSADEVAQKPKNTYFVMRHGEAENNLQNILNSTNSPTYHLTEKGTQEVTKSAKKIKEKVDLIFCSPIIRAKETAEIVAKTVGYPSEKIVVDDRLREMQFGELDGGHKDGYSLLFPSRAHYFAEEAKGVENRHSIKRRVGEFIEDMEKKFAGKTILIISHDGPLWMMGAAARGLDIDDTLEIKPQGQQYIEKAQIRLLDYKILPHNKDYELDLHKPFIDEVKLKCKCGGVMTRAKEVMDVWLDSGSMPFAQDHYPFENKKFVEKSNYPADFISEAIDQTRGWFYTLHAIGTIMGFGKAYKNVICLGHILDEKGKKMSKSIGNVVDPIKMMNKYGADALRMWMYSVNQPGDSKNFEEKTVDEVVKKVFNMVDNVLSFYKLYDGNVKLKNQNGKLESQNVLDKWIVARLNQLIETVTAGLDAYKFMEPTRAIRDFVADLSQWYLQSSRDRFKGDQKEKEQALSTLRYILVTLSKIMAPFAPFFADYVYLEVNGDLESVHLEDWPKAGEIDGRLIEDMETTRKIVEVVLSLRSYKKIGVRQPLSRLVYELGTMGTDGKKKRADVSDDFRSIIKEKLNVKDVASLKITVDSTPAVLEKDGKLYVDSGGIRVELDTVITPALKEEGTVRELIRAIQDLRKQKGLSVNDKVELVVDTNEDGKSLIEKNSKTISAAASLSRISFGGVEGESQNIGGLIIKLRV